jgi:hypothetical protein
VEDRTIKDAQLERFHVSSFDEFRHCESTINDFLSCRNPPNIAFPR